MAAPVKVFDVTWELRLTNALASAIKLAAAGEGSSRREWIRQACKEKLDREARKHRNSA